ncbi:FAD-binding oxidoreductase [Microbacterium sp. NPDC056569]|uniref:FAD-binding oxidoreductase n=1 Tax=Microbacterium sp. NPDC056569 TaxID=3345867 RepID=UPI00366E0BD1
MMTLPVLPPELETRAVRAGHPEYPALRSTYTTTRRPELVLRPRDEHEVAAAVRYAAASGRVLSVRSGGHGLAGTASNDGGIVIDVGALREVTVIHTPLVRIGAGARWGEVAARLAPLGLAISSGDHGNVGVGGLAVAGGVGWLTRSFGLTIDRVRAAAVVTASGEIIRVDHTQPELLWALRGAGDALGIVTSFDIDAMPLGDIGIAQVVVEADAGGDTLRRWSEHLSQAPRELTTNGLLFSQGASGFVLQLTAVVASDDQHEIRRLVQPLAQLGVRTLGLQASVAPYSALISADQLHSNVGQQPSNTTNALFPTFDAPTAKAVMDLAAHPASPFVQLRSLGGVVNDVPADATAWAHRHQQVLVVASTFPPDGGRGLDAAFAPLQEYADGAYRNFESRPHRSSLERAFPGTTGERVSEIRERLDPEGVFWRGRREFTRPEDSAAGLAS